MSGWGSTRKDVVRRLRRAPRGEVGLQGVRLREGGAGGGGAEGGWGRCGWG